MKLKCDGCGYSWNYLGLRKITATCPDCKKQIYIDKTKVNSNNNDTTDDDATTTTEDSQ